MPTTTSPAEAARERGVGARSDDPDEDVDQRFRAVLEGLRTTLPGAQVLVGFLLVLPFQTNFAETEGVGRGLFLAAFTSAVLASALLIAPSVHQRVRAPFSGVEREHEDHLRSAVRTTIAGTISLAVALVSTVAMVVGRVTESWIGGAVAAAVALAIAYTWAWQPLVLFRHGHDDA